MSINYKQNQIDSMCFTQKLNNFNDEHLVFKC